MTARQPDPGAVRDLHARLRTDAALRGGFRPAQTLAALAGGLPEDDLTKDGTSALHLAIWGGHVAMAEWLVDGPFDECDDDFFDERSLLGADKRTTLPQCGDAGVSCGKTGGHLHCLVVGVKR